MNPLLPPTVALLTPRGRGAIAVVALEGARCGDYLQRHFRPAGKRSWREPPPGSTLLGDWDGEELILSRVGETQWEVQCHGGPIAARRIVSTMVGEGCRHIAWQDWLRKTAGSSLELEARIALAETQSRQTAEILLDQYLGALRGAVSRVLQQIGTGALAAAHQELDQILTWAELGNHLTVPWRVVLTGAPNVGKSSLLNALVGEGRALVWEEPGTTRDVVTAVTAIQGWPVALIDTAGLRSSDEPLELAGMRRTRMVCATADLQLLVIDARQPTAAQAQAPAAEQRATILVRNKADLISLPASPATADLYVSCLAGTGIAALLEAVARQLVPRVPPRGAAVPFTARQVDCLRTARDRLADDPHASQSRLQSMLASSCRFSD